LNPIFAAALEMQEFCEGRLSDAREFALRNRVVLLRSALGVPIDVALGAMPFEERAVVRASTFSVQSGVELTTCSAEDLIVFKAFAGREKDWLDIEGIAVRQGDQLDQTLIWAELAPLLELKEAPEDATRLRALLTAPGPESAPTADSRPLTSLTPSRGRVIVAASMEPVSSG